MRRSPLFKGLTRPVTLAGLPANYLIILILVVMGGFVITSSPIYLFSSGPIGYVALRIVAAYDPRFFDVLFVVLQNTPINLSQVKGKGTIYHA